jgi:hypothetical protein
MDFAKLSETGSVVIIKALIGAGRIGVHGVRRPE